MVTSVKMDEDTKARLERLQAEIRLQTDRRVTQQAILDRLVERAVESKPDVIDSFRSQRVPIPEGDRERFHLGMVSSGVREASDDTEPVRDP